MDTLFSHITAVTMDEAMYTYFDCFVGVTDGKIAYLSKTAPKEQPKQIINGEGMVLMPGLMNCHVHLPMSLLRGYADDCEMRAWLEDAVLPREEKLDGRAARAATLLSIAECVRFGVTSVSDMDAHCDEIAQAAADSGIKVNLAPALKLFTDENEPFDFHRDEGCRQLRQLKEKWHGYDNGRILVQAGIHAEYTSDYRLWESVSEYADDEKLGIQLHLSETKNEHESCKEKYGLTPAQLLDCHRVFEQRTTAAHCVWLEPDDMRLLAKRHVSAVHCPGANLKLACGCADVTAMIRAGMNVALGTDGAASSNNLDLFGQMKAACLTAKAREESAAALPAQAVLMMATVCGARAQGRERECGMIKLGMDADLVMLDFTAPHLMPCHNVISQLVYAACGYDVMMTMVRGKILYAAGNYPTIDLDTVVRELAQYAMPTVFTDKPEQDAPLTEKG